MNHYDIEFLIIFFIIIGLLLYSVKFDVSDNWSLLKFDKSTTAIIKGISCLFILMSHWGTIRFSEDLPWGVSKLVHAFAANFALVWFMFFSGYGLSLKSYEGKNIFKEWRTRIIKIYFPLVFICTSAAIIYCLLPDIFSEDQAKKLWVNPNIHILHNFEISNFSRVLKQCFGLFDWYVFCILLFYTFFYLALYVSKKLKWNLSIVLGAILLFYNICAIPAFGWDKAHYFRYPWAFMLGHIIAMQHKNKAWINRVTLTIFTLTMLIHIKEPVMFLSFIGGIVGLLIFSCICKRVSINSKPLIWLGGVSYFFYLSHERIGYQLLVYLGSDSVCVWIFVTLIVSSVLMKLYETIKEIILQ